MPALTMTPCYSIMLCFLAVVLIVIMAVPLIVILLRKIWDVMNVALVKNKDYKK